jgi:hypothetical protein
MTCRWLRATFDDPNLVSCAGLEPVMGLARTARLHAAVADRVHLPGETGSNPAVRVATIVAGMRARMPSLEENIAARLHQALDHYERAVILASTARRGLAAGRPRKLLSSY